MADTQTGATTSGPGTIAAANTVPDSAAARTPDSDTTTGAGNDSGMGSATSGGQTTGGQITGGNIDNAVTTGNMSRGTAGAGTVAGAPANAPSGAAGGGRAVPDQNVLQNRSASSTGNSLDDAGGQAGDGLAGNQDTETGSMTTDVAALGGGVTIGGAATENSAGMGNEGR